MQGEVGKEGTRGEKVQERVQGGLREDQDLDGSEVGHDGERTSRHMLSSSCWYVGGMR